VNAIVLDTDTVSLYRKGRLPASQVRHVDGGAICLSFATVGELHKWAIVHGWGAATRGGFELWLDQVTILPYDPGVARTWGHIAAGAQLRGRRRPQNDTWIAACCIRSGLPLLTQNRRHFADFALHDGLVLLAP
jgi:predicted nucleic acid-binding protein